MLPEGLQALLILQDRDARRTQLEKNLAQLPRDRAAIEGRIAAHRAAIESARRGLAEVELRRKQVESTLRDLEEQIRRYKNQQLQVKKNDEYQALTHEIELTEARIGEAEESEIRLLYELDTTREQAVATERRMLEEIEVENGQLARLGEREQHLRSEIDAARAEVEKAREGVPAGWLPRYDRLVRDVGLPVVVPLQAQKCGGCHLKVSAGVVTEARKGTEIVACDNCSRIVYFEA